MSKHRFTSKAFKDLLGPLAIPGPAHSRSHASTSSAVLVVHPKPERDLVNNLATALRIGKDAAGVLDRFLYVKAVTGIVAQMIKVYEVICEPDMLNMWWCA